MKKVALAVLLFFVLLPASSAITIKVPQPLLIENASQGVVIEKNIEISIVENISLRTTLSTAGLVGWVAVEPKTFFLGSNNFTIRVRASPPKDAQDGVYKEIIVLTTESSGFATSASVHSANLVLLIKVGNSSNAPVELGASPFVLFFWLVLAGYICWKVYSAHKSKKVVNKKK